MIYKVNEVFSSIQGEGARTGALCVFVRMSGCNMRCAFCDTKHETYTEYYTSELVDKIKEVSLNGKIKHIVFTGGEPLIQNLEEIVCELVDLGFYSHLETNGSIACKYAHFFYHISVSPKSSLNLNITMHHCDSLKILYPYVNGVEAKNFEHCGIDNKFIVPIDNSKINILGAIKELHKLSSAWRLGVQVHKLIGVP